MKSIRLYIILFLFGLLTGCFEDEGNYSYEEINPPLWSDNFNTSSLNVWLVMREMVKS